MGKIHVATQVAIFTSGVVTERIAQSQRERDASPPSAPAEPKRPPHPLARSGSGNERAMRLAQSIHPDADRNTVFEGVVKKVGNMGKTAGNTAAVVKNPEMFTKQDMEKVRQNWHATVGFGKLAAGTETLTMSDAARLGQAGVKDAVERFDPTKPWEAAKTVADTAYAVGTTRQEGIDAFTAAGQALVKSEAKEALAGSAAVHALAAGLRRSRNPKYKAAGLVLEAWNTAASGTQMSETMRELGGGGGKVSNVRQTAADILAEAGRGRGDAT